MWNFYCRPSKQKAGRRKNEIFGQSTIMELQDTLKCLWLQSLLLLLFCLDCSCAPTESLISDSPHAETLHVKHNFPVLNVTHTPEMHHSVTPVPVWKPEVLKHGLKTLRAHPITSVSFHKLYKHRRLFKRDFENLSQKNSTGLPKLASTLTEILRSAPQTTPSMWGPLSEMQTPFPKLENVSLMHVSSVEKTFPAAEGQTLSMLKNTTLATPDTIYSTGSLNKEANTSDFLVQSESTLPSTHDSSYRNVKHTTKLMNYTDLLGSPSVVTGGTKLLTENGSSQSTTFTPKTSSGYANNDLDELPNFALKTVEQYNALNQLATDRFNLPDASAHPTHEATTFSSLLISSPETSAIGIQHVGDIPVTGTPLSSALASSTVLVNLKLYSQSSTPLSVLHSGFPDVHPSSYPRRDNWDLASITPQTLALGDLSDNTRHVETKTSLNADPNTADLSYTTKQKTRDSSVVTGSFFMLSNMAVHVQHDDFPTQTIPYTSKTEHTSKHHRSLDQQRDTSKTFSASTLLPQTLSTEEMSHSISWKTSNTDFNTLSSVTPTPYQVEEHVRVLQIHDPPDTETPKSETFRLSTIYKSTEEKRDSTVFSTSNSVTPNDGSTLVESTFTDVTSELGFQSSMTTSFQHDAFNDMINGNDMINQSAFNLNSTFSALMSTLAKKPLTTFTSLWKSRSSQQLNSTVEPVQKIQTSRSTLYSTGESKVSRSVNSTGGQHFQNHSNVPSSSDARSYLGPTTIPAALQRTISTKLVADLESSSLQTSTYYHSTNRLSQNINFTRYRMTTQQTSSSSRPPLTVTVTSNYPKQSLVTSTVSKAHLKTQTASSTTMKPSTTTKLTTLSLSTIVTPAPKLWVPQTVFTLEPITTQIISLTPTTAIPGVVIPLSFQLTGVSFSEKLANRTSKEYRQLEREIKLVMDKIFFAKYQNDYLDTEIQAFLKGSVIVMSNIVFQDNIYVPSGSEIIRTVLTDGTKMNYFGWSINGSTVETNGYTKSSLELEVLPISLLVLRAGYIAISQKNQEKQSFLDNLQKAVFQAVYASFPITNISILEIRDVYGDLKVRGNLYLNSTVHTNVQSLMSSLLSLVDRSVDLSSITVNGFGIELQVYSINFRVTNRKFVFNFLDMSSSESQLLSKDLSTVVQSVLHDSNPLQVVVREFKSGSVVCRGDIMYHLPAPGSWEILRIFLKNLASDGILGSSTYKVDIKSIAIGDAIPGLSNEYIDFPGFGVAIIVMCGLCIIIFPIILFLCTKTSLLGHRQKATIQRRHNPIDQSHNFELDNQAFRASIEQP